MLSLISPVIIFLLNFILALFLFRFVVLQASIEPTVWVQVKFIAENWPNLSWFPNWYLGFPFRFSGPHIFTYLLALFNKLTNFQIPEIESVILTTSLAIFSVGVYFLVKFLTQSISASFLAALAFTVLPSAGYIFPQAATIGADFGFLPWRFVGFLTFGGGARLASLAILPFLIILFWQTITIFSRKKFVLTAALVAILLLTDFASFTSFLIFAVAIIATEGIRGEWVEKAKRGLIIIITAAGLSAFWYTPSYILNILASPSLAGLSFGQILQRLFQFALVAVPVFLAVFGFAAKKLSKSEIFLILSISFFSFLTLLWWATDTDFLTLYSRFFTEIDLTIALALGLIIQNLKTQNYNLKLKTFQFLVVVLTFALLTLSFSWRVYEFAKAPKYEPKLEKEIAEWLKTNISPTERVYLSGSAAFWLNWFAPEVSQVRGGVDSAATHPFWAHASFNLREGESAQTALAWLKALRVKYVVVHEPNSAEFYHDFKNPGKFGQIGKVVFGNGAGDKIFQISTADLAQVINSQILKLEKPENGADFENLSKYVQVLEQGREADFEWLAPNKIKIKTESLQAGDGISLGVTYDAAWNAECKAENAKCKVKIKKDPIGNLFVHVQERVLNMQEVEITLEHGARWDNWVGYFISIFTLFLIVKPVYAKKLFAKLPKLHFGLEEEY